MVCHYYLLCEYRKDTLPRLLEISFHTYEATGNSGRRTCVIDSEYLRPDVDGFFQDGDEDIICWGLVHLVSAELNRERALIGIQENGKSSVSYFSVCKDNISKGKFLRKR